MATFYFAAGENSNWSTPANWYTNEACTIPAAALPTSADSVVAGNGVITLDTPRTVVNFLKTGPFLAGGNLNNTLTVTGLATFVGSVAGATVIGNCLFDSGSSTMSPIFGNCTFDNESWNYSTVHGNAWFYNGSTNNSTVTEDAFFDESSNGYIVNGDATFDHGSANDQGGRVEGNATFLNGSYMDVTPSTPPPVIVGDATFDLASAVKQIAGNAGVPYRCAVLGAVIFKYEKGINGSSILGVI